MIQTLVRQSLIRIAASLVLVSGVLVWATAKHGLEMQTWAERGNEPLPGPKESRKEMSRSEEQIS